MREFGEPESRNLVRSRDENPSKTVTWILGIAGAVLVGAIVFGRTRRAAAASSGSRAFEVSADCQTIRVVSEAEARAAATAAAIVVHPSASSPALPVLQQALAVAIPQCDWQDVPPDRTFIHNGAHYTWQEIETLIGTRTLGQLTELVGQAQGIARQLPPQLSAIALPPLLLWMLLAPVPVATSRRRRSI